MTRTILTKSDDGGTIVVTYHDRRGLVQFRQGGRPIPNSQINVEPYTRDSEVKALAIEALSE